MEVIPGVTCLRTQIANFYLILEDDKLTLVDAGVRSSFDHIMKAIRALGRSPQDLARILLTHADIDHVGAAMALKEISGAEICASRIAADALAQGRSSREVRAGFVTPAFNWFERSFGVMDVTVDVILAEGDTLPVLDGLEVIATSGHTPGHLSFFAPKRKLLFAGDAVSNIRDRIIGNRRKMFNWDPEKYRQSMQKLEALHPEIVCSGHGPVVFKAAGKFVLP